MGGYEDQSLYGIHVKQQDVKVFATTLFASPIDSLDEHRPISSFYSGISPAYVVATLPG